MHINKKNVATAYVLLYLSTRVFVKLAIKKNFFFYQYSTHLNNTNFK